MANLELMELFHHRADPMFGFKWEAKLQELPFGLPSHFLESVDLPFNNIKIGETIYGGGKYFNYPGSHSIGTVNLVLYEDQEATATKWITLWKSKIKDMKTGIYKLPGDGTSGSAGYKQPFTVTMLDTRNKRIMDVKLIGMWPESTSNWSLNYTDDGRLTVSQSFSIDDQELIF